MYGIFPAWTSIIGFWLGATVGSFLNVVIYRTPRGMHLGQPVYSFCPKCKHRLEIPDLIPLLSWLALRGKCRHCGAKVSGRYFLVELVNGLIWMGIWYQYFCAADDIARAVAYALAASTLVAIIFIDWELYIIPDQINAFLAVVGIGYNIWLFIAHDARALTWGIPSALAGWLVGVGVLWGIAFFGRVAFGKDAMGHGDIKMARGIGAVLFPSVAVISFGLAVVMGAFLGVAQVLIRRSPPDLSHAAQTSSSSDPSEGSDEPSANEETLPPESIGSLLFCGLGYLLGIDIIGLAIPKVYIAWFKESPEINPEEWADYPVEHTMIPFGPYLALGAIIATVFATQLQDAVRSYLDWSSGRGKGSASISREIELTRVEHNVPYSGLLKGEGRSVRI